MKCIECKRPMRNARTLLADHPGTVPARARGLCQGCHKRRMAHGVQLPPTIRKPGRPKNTSTVPCEGYGCTKTLRPYHTSEDDYPGTHVRKGGNRCSACYEKRFTESRATPEGVARTAAALDAYLAWRRPHREKQLLTIGETS